MLGTGEILIIAGVVVFVFGASQIPKLARSVGEGMKELKKSMKEVKEIDGIKDESIEENTSV